MDRIAFLEMSSSCILRWDYNSKAVAHAMNLPCDLDFRHVIHNRITRI